MLISELPLEGNEYIDINNTEDILKAFYQKNSLFLPVVKNKEILGILSLEKLMKKYAMPKEINMEEFIDSNYDFACESDEIYIYKNIEQKILPIKDSVGLYLGFIKTEVLKAYIEFESHKKSITKKYDDQIQYYKDIKDEYDAIFESSYDGIYITDGNGTTLGINKACERIEGITAKDVLGKHMKDLVAEGLYSESVTLKVLEEKKSVTILQKAKNGKIVIATGNPIFKNGKIIKVVTNSRDITELNNLKKELQEVQQLTQKYETELELLREEQIQTNEIVMASEKMKKIVKTVIHVSKVDSTVLIQGESGVGKEIIAKMIHRHSKRKEGPFIKIDCGAIPENLLESELFGYDKGAFTGASPSGKIGLVELANGGTLFLDELGELPLVLQVKLLRVIQDREIYRVGGKNPIPMDIRIVAATNRNLNKMVEEGSFREDLYYRLDVVPLCVPPLRDRPEDIYPLINDFLNTFNKKYGLKKRLSQAAMEGLLRFNWPGNVRELENIIERLLVITDSDIIDYENLPPKIKNYQNNQEDLFTFPQISSYRTAVDHFEKNLFLNVMKQSNSTQEMADLLEIDRSTVTRKLKKHGIQILF